MMMERAKTAPAPEPQTTSASASEQIEKPVIQAPSAPTTGTAEERVQDLERRLNMLGGEDAPAAAAPTAPVAPAPAAPVAAAPPKEAQTGKNNPLLKRIQAAQERARLAEQKEKEAAAASAAEIERQKRAEDEARQRAAEEQRIQKAQSALRSVAGRALEDKQKSILAQLEGKSPVPAPTAESATMSSPEKPAEAVPIMKSLDRPPPSFDSMKFPPPKEMQQQIQHPHMPVDSQKMVGHGMNSRVLNQHLPPPEAFGQAPQQQQAAAPPSFDFVESQMMAPTTPMESAPPAPTAPALTPTAPPPATIDYLQGVMPMAPPVAPPAASAEHTQVQMPPPPSFAAFEQQQHAPPPATEQANVAQDDDGVFDYDLDGNPLSAQQKLALMDEQRLLYERIMEEKAANDAAIAQANADAFDLRSSSAAARAMPGGENSIASHNQAMDSVGQDVATPGAASAAAAGTAEGEAGDEAARAANRRMVKIGDNQMVALHGQDRTKKAIKEGTAILVQCVSCQNWMQVTDTATLMFCPVCQVVSPVIQQNEVMTKEEAIQLTMDRKLAEKLQAEAYGAGDEEDEEEEEGKDAGFLSNFFGGIGGAVADSTDATVGALTSSGSKPAAGAAAQQPDTWWNKISSIVSYGVADENKERGSMGVTMPPGAPAASKYPAQQRSSATAAASSRTHHEETRGLLSSVVTDGNEANLPSGRVAEQKPLFSCVMDSVSQATNAMFSGEDAEGNVHGVDGSTLLVTNAGRGVGDGAGDYSRVSDRD